MERATAGFVTASYFYNLLGDRIKQPGLDKLKAIADAMGFPSEFWLEGPDRWTAPTAPGGELRLAREEAGFTELLENLFRSFPDARTGEPPTNAEITTSIPLLLLFHPPSESTSSRKLTVAKSVGTVVVLVQQAREGAAHCL